MTENSRWQAICQNDSRYDGQFVYAVATTGVYCRPSCPSPRPRREHVHFFETPTRAHEAGYRPCRRCRPAGGDDDHAAVIRAVVDIIDETADGLPSLETLAERTGYSPSHLQRLFSRTMGLSPRAFAEARRRARFRSELRAGEEVAGAIYGAGYSGPSRVYEQAAATLGMTPATYRKGGAGVDIRHAAADSALGRVLVGATGKGIAFVALGDDDDSLIEELHGEFPAASISADHGGLSEAVRVLTAFLGGRTRALDLPLDVCATAFQWRVWRALTDIPYGEVRTYKQIAGMIGAPKAARAVGRACATNPASLVVPCHRAIGSDGAMHGYRWGLERKRALLAMERPGP